MVIARPVPTRGDVDVWVLPGASADPLLAEVRLHADETAQAGRMATPALRARAVRRRRFLRRVLSAYLGVTPEAVAFTVAPGGKPGLAGAAPFAFNLSHTGDLSLLAIGLDTLGLDVERRKSFERLAEVVGYACSPRERLAILAAADPTAAFLDRWAIKEAVLKCRGTGLISDLPGVDPGPVGADPVASGGMTLRMIAPPEALAPGATLHAALAVEGRVETVRFHGLDALGVGPGDRTTALPSPLAGEGARIAGG